MILWLPLNLHGFACDFHDFHVFHSFFNIVMDSDVMSRNLLIAMIYGFPGFFIVLWFSRIFHGFGWIICFCKDLMISLQFSWFYGYSGICMVLRGSYVFNLLFRIAQIFRMFSGSWENHEIDRETIKP